ncbi:MAG: tRNA pseudouridine(55) synthase TruB [Saccharofermentans sp.]|nr:tRNA pseudouridine(55) synthase TruB [Saccharofermentans sp.]
MIDGVIAVYKEKGYTSSDAVAVLRGILHQKKIGHTGTLDPDAEGVLPVCLGKATKLASMVIDSSKEYRAEMTLGISTDTQDISGNIISRREVNVSASEAEDALMSFIGDYAQLPPMYSAVKVNGQRLYTLARKGAVVERKPRNVIIYGIRDIVIDLPKVSFTVSCSKGTYIRTLCSNLGDKLGCGGTMTSLVRTRSGGFAIEESLKLSEIEALVKEDPESFLSKVKRIDDILSVYPAAHTSSEIADRMLHSGNPLSPDKIRISKDSPAVSNSGSGFVRMYDSRGVFIALYNTPNNKGKNYKNLYTSAIYFGTEG